MFFAKTKLSTLVMGEPSRSKVENDLQNNSCFIFTGLHKVNNMSGFNQDDGFFQSGYYENQQAQQPQEQYAGYEYGGQQFGQEQ